jgi:predicted regulator of Ras-like GTPase activity (Roadblock/LC7/MglB family)
METILQGLMELAGVRAAIVLDGAGQVVAHRGHAVYDRAVCGQVGATVTKAIESIQLQQEDWETIAAQFAEGRVLLRRVGTLPGGPRLVLAVVADATLNASFATVALRVAASKLKGLADGAGSQPLGSAAGSSPALSPSDSRPVLANSGLSWSKGGSNVGSQASGSSSGGLSGVVAADPASAEFLVRCAKELARHVGPMAKVYVQEAVRRVSPDGPFAVGLARALVDDLAQQIESVVDRGQFRKAAFDRK